MQRQLSAITALKGKDVHMVPKDTTVSDAVAEMTEKKIGAILVGQGDEIQGILSERDVLTRVIHKGLDCGATPVSDVMTIEPLTVPPTTTVEEALKIVSERYIRHLPMVDDGKLVGMVSNHTIIRRLFNIRRLQLETIIYIPKQLKGKKSLSRYIDNHSI